MSERLKPFPIGYSPEVSPEWEWMAKRFIRGFLNTATKEIVVKGKLPEDITQAPYIVVVNHLAWAEAIVLLDIFPVWIHWMTKSENFDHKLLGPVFRLSGLFPVRRGKVDRRALQTARDLLEEKRILGMAPEGTRGRGDEFGKLKKAKLGTILIATQTHAPIIPTAVWGTEKLWPLIEEAGLKLEDLTGFQRPEVFVRIGKLFTQHLEESMMSDKDRLERLTTNLMLKIRDLLPEKFHGFYAGVEPQSL